MNTYSLFNYVHFRNIHLNPIKLLWCNDQDLPYTKHLFFKIYSKKEKRKIQEG